MSSASESKHVPKQNQNSGIELRLSETLLKSMKQFSGASK